MSVIQKLKNALPVEEDSAASQTYECRECGAVFESEKKPGRVVCTECSSADVEPKS